MRFLTALVSAGQAADSDLKPLPSVFARANASYESGDFIGAEKLYRQVLDSGVENGAVFYNLGNACFKQKKIGAAIYYWEKARQVLPHDADVRTNLELANLYVVDRIEEMPDPLPIRWLRNAIGVLTMEQESWLVLGLFLVANILVAFCIRTRRPSVALKALVSACVVGLLAWLRRIAGMEGLRVETRQEGSRSRREGRDTQWAGDRQHNRVHHSRGDRPEGPQPGEWLVPGKPVERMERLASLECGLDPLVPRFEAVNRSS